MVVIPGRVLSGPRLKYGGSASIIPKGGAWNMSGRKFLKSAVMPSWTLLRIGVADEIPDDLLASKLKALTDVFTKCGLKNGIAKEFPGPSKDLTRVTNGERTVDKALERIFEEYQEKGISFLLVILPSADSSLFSRVKFWGDVRYGIDFL